MKSIEILFTIKSFLTTKQTIICPNVERFHEHQIDEEIKHTSRLASRKIEFAIFVSGHDGFENEFGTHTHTQDYER